MVMCSVCSEQLDCWYDGPDVRCEGLKCENGIHATCAGLTPGHTGEWFCSEHQVGEGGRGLVQNLHAHREPASSITCCCCGYVI